MMVRIEDHLTYLAMYAVFIIRNSFKGASNECIAISI